MRTPGLIFALLIAATSVSANEIDWSGGYVGALAGAARVDTDVSATLGGEWSAPSHPANIQDRDSLTPLLNRDLRSTGAFGGLAIGYNFQNAGLVYGAEADISVLDGDVSRTQYNTPGIPIAPQPYRLETSSKIDWLATFRTRVGWAFDRSLIYVTGGLAVGKHAFRQHIVQLNLPMQEYTETGAFDDTSVGWTLGAGFEHALSKQWSLKFQYLHVDLGSHSTTSAGTCLLSPAFCEAFTGSHKADLTLDTVSAGINYRF